MGASASRPGRARSRLVRTLSATAATIIAVPVAAVASAVLTAAPAVHAAGTYNKLPGDDIQFIYLPDDCGSNNIEGAGTRVRTNIGVGSTLFVGTTITVTVGIVKTISNGSNDGPDPLILELKPNGYLQQAAPTVGSPVDYPHNVTWGGDGSTGPKAPYGTYGYSFDANSSPTVFGPHASDGTDEMITISFTATKAGDITIPMLKVSGYDGTPIGGDVGCHLDLGLVWHIIDLSPPAANKDIVYTDARYAPVEADDATTGSHNISIDVLANDSDPNLPPGSNVKIASWSSNLDCGNDALNGATPTADNFDALAVGPCRYTPAVGALEDAASYTVVQRSGLLTRDVDVVINLLSNEPPVVNPFQLDVTPLQPVNGTLADDATDPEGDPLVCIPGSAQVITPGGGTFSVGSDCVYAYSAPAVDGDYDVSAEVCDNHATAANNALGDATRAAGYEIDPVGNDDDLDSGHTQRCSTIVLTFTVKSLGLLPAMKPKDDFDTVDSGYPAEDYFTGPYNLAIQVLANDNLLGGTVYSLTITVPPIPAQGAAAIRASGNPQSPYITFTPTIGYVGPVKMRYQVCAHVGQPNQDVCASANVYVTVVGNRRPQPKNDDFGLLYREEYAEFPQLNDKEPDLDPIQCSTTLPAANPPEAFAVLSMQPNCTLTIKSAPTYTGPATVTYRECDIHFLQNPQWPDPLGYGPLAIPGGTSHRCADATIAMSFADPPPLVDVPVPGPANGPTCVADAFETTQGKAITSDVLANDSDLDAINNPAPLFLIDPGAPVTQQGGTIANDGGQLRYTPAADFVGVDVAAYDAVDADAHGCNAQVTYTVKADSDGDGVPNDSDPDADGDDVPNAQDPDVDGDGIPNGQDPDIDGDGVPNGQDPDADGDGIPNESDTDANGDGLVDNQPPAMPEVPTELPSTGAAPATTAAGATVLLVGGIAFVVLGWRRRRPARTAR